MCTYIYARTHIYLHAYRYIYTHIHLHIHTHPPQPPPHPPQAQQRGLVPGRSRGPRTPSPRPEAPRRGPGKPAGGRAGRGAAAGTQQRRAEPVPRSPTGAGSAATGTVRPTQGPGQRHFRSRQEAPGSARSPLRDAPREVVGRGGDGGFASRCRQVAAAPGPALPPPRPRRQHPHPLGVDVPPSPLRAESALLGGTRSRARRWQHSRARPGPHGCLRARPAAGGRAVCGRRGLQGLPGCSHPRPRVARGDEAGVARSPGAFVMGHWGLLRPGTPGLWGLLRPPPLPSPGQSPALPGGLGADPSSLQSS